jgi:6-phosphogluconolactonase (cycloisomerase 2 family)
MLTAELLIASPNSTFTKAFVYVSNRNDPHPGGDTIAVFSTVTPSEPNLTLLSETRTGLNHLRGMIFFGDDDRYLIAGGANGGGIKVFERTGDGSTLQEVAFLGVEAAGADAGDAGFCPTGFLAL